MFYLFLTCAWLAAAPAFMGYVANSRGEPIVGAIISIKGPNYEVDGPTDAEGYGMIYLNEAIAGDTCHVLVSARGYVSFKDTIVMTRDTFVEYRLRRVGE